MWKKESTKIDYPFIAKGKFGKNHARESEKQSNLTSSFTTIIQVLSWGFIFHIIEFHSLFILTGNFPHQLFDP